ncbi:Oidioi.mRNA.OKI2018_I69.XSR.g14173.t2.cds [Oikopleura dioica]|uniref:Oidioi.mRNA.OKI2018_I69.XSR.g14173.t2.cds n=1 Tax=Oikopleura dioica TaxID=34765 RepID=A0ABN7SD22_OIKDI|nr:Oidioi.mRNA.OKI2018_I69.XSR.g14173.t2.cds [Oikopleura dioica]
MSIKVGKKWQRAFVLIKNADNKREEEKKEEESLKSESLSYFSERRSPDETRKISKTSDFYRNQNRWKIAFNLLQKRKEENGNISQLERLGRPLDFTETSGQSDVKVFPDFVLLKGSEDVLSLIDEELLPVERTEEPKKCSIVTINHTNKGHLMIPLLREEEQPLICRQYNCFKIEDIKNIMIAKSKKKKYRKIAMSCSLSGPFYQLVGILHLNITIETRMLGRRGTEAIEKEIEEVIWKHRSTKYIRPNSTVQENLPSALANMSCENCLGSALDDCARCGGDGVVECPQCGGMGDMACQDEVSLCDDVEFDMGDGHEEQENEGYEIGTEVSNGVHMKEADCGDCDNCGGDGEVECMTCGGVQVRCKNCTDGVYKKFTIARKEHVLRKAPNIFRDYPPFTSQLTGWLSNCRPLFVSPLQDLPESENKQKLLKIVQTELKNVKKECDLSPSRKVIFSPSSKPTIEWIPLHIVQYSHSKESGLMFIGGRDCSLYKIKRETSNKCSLM